MKSYFFNAESTTDFVTYPTGFDREYDADDHAAFFEPLFSEAGVMAGTHADACKVKVLTGATLQISAGAVYVRGRMAVLDGTETVIVPAELANQCRIVARMNKTADVRGFQLLAVTTLQKTEDIHDLELATATLTPIIGGYETKVTDSRTFLSFMGQPAYYPPNSDSLPYVLWLYTLGFPLTPEQRAAVANNPSLMNIYNTSLGPTRAATVTFAAEAWSAAGVDGLRTITIPAAEHGRVSSKFGYAVRHLVGGQLLGTTWAARCTDANYNTETGIILLRSADAYPGEIVFFAA